MTRDDLDRTLDAMDRALIAAGDPQRRPGPITVQRDLWVGALANAVRATCSALLDGLRYRDIQIHVGAA